MKRTLLLLTICLATIAGASILFFESKEKVITKASLDGHNNQLESKIAQPNMEQTPSEYSEKPLPNEYQFVVSISTKMRNQTMSLGEVNYRFNMALKPVSAGSEQLMGQVYNIQWSTDPQGEDRPVKLTFTTRIDNGAFTNTDLLGLNPSHPLTIIETTLTQFSYFSGNQTLTLADGKHRFFYARENAEQIDREWLGAASNAQTYQVTEQSDEWRLIHNDIGFPQSLNHTHTRTVEYESRMLTVVQQTDIKPVGKLAQLDWKMEQFVAMFNQKWKGLDSATAKNMGKVDDQNFQERFAEYTQSPDLDSAHLIGAYLADQGFSTIKDWLTNQNLSDDQQSLMIFALERSQSPEGEYILSQLIEDNTLDEENRLRAIMSIAKMGEVNSVQALHTLEAVSGSDNQVIAETALLNIGILGNQSKALKGEVSDYLAHNLKLENSPYVTLVSIDNLNNRELDNDVVKYLKSENFDERVVAVKVLARNPEMESRLRNLALNDSNPNVVKEIVGAHLAKSSSLHFDTGYQNQLRNRITDSDVPTPTKEMLFEYLMSGSDDTANNRDVAEQLMNDPELSDSMRTRLEEMLNS
ncbi:HEAT repeat domain-containing protein [Vibrio nigripulchritudo]|uniref:HEAT repeat domain-containing protein n=1 Tax=Vibrio nigripulchritudo TaxID=28173 RepID=UPI0005F9F04A|nr:HEAT repeat domain-containing protein [Vibrio nigripulchritudo]KJY79538.1 hypothetical protein TW74_08805 [Vibrio nigripulchritudo]